MRRFMVLSILIAAVLSAASAGGLSGTRTTLAWRVVATGATVPLLSDVAVVATEDVWAVGSDAVSGTKRHTPIIVHWDGGQLQRYSSFDPLIPDGRLWAVSAAPPDDVWAVGGVRAKKDGDDSQPIAVRWDGDQWLRVELPALTDASLDDVAVRAADDVWIVGSVSRPPRPLVLHWNGRSWRVDKLSKLVPADSALSSVVAISTNNVWVTGTDNLGLVDYDVPLWARDQLMLHWDGLRWKEVSGGASEGEALDASSTGAVWALA
jgi:hypothetical protein